MSAVQIEIDASGVRSQAEEALRLIEQAPERFQHHLSKVLLECISGGSFEFEIPDLDTATGAPQDLIRYRPRIVGRFEEIVSAMRA